MIEKITFDNFSALIGRLYNYQVGEISVHCKILGAKNAYGNIRILITPVSGSGQKWVNFCDKTLIKNREGV